MAKVKQKRIEGGLHCEPEPLSDEELQWVLAKLDRMMDSEHFDSVHFTIEFQYHPGYFFILVDKKTEEREELERFIDMRDVRTWFRGFFAREDLEHATEDK